MQSPEKQGDEVESNDKAEVNGIKIQLGSNPGEEHRTIWLSDESGMNVGVDIKGDTDPKEVFSRALNLAAESKSPSELQTKILAYLNE